MLGWFDEEEKIDDISLLSAVEVTQEVVENSQEILEEKAINEFKTFISIKDALGKSYNELVAMLGESANMEWELWKYDDRYDISWSSDDSNTAYWYFWEHYFRWYFQDKNTPINSFFLSTNAEWSLPMKQYIKMFWLDELDENQYAMAGLKEERNTGVNVGKEAEQRNKTLKAIDDQLSDLDGSHYELKQLIKASMDDPRSFDHVKTTYSVVEEGLFIRTQFRGNNAFGAKVLDSVGAIYDLDGNLVRIVEEQ